jgi:hypothetical protein
VSLVFAWPLALAGLAVAALIPLVIHLLGRRRPDEEPLPTVRFLEDAPRPRRRLSPPRDVAVLIARALGLSALVLAAAGPRLTSGAPAPDDGPVAVVIDDTLSMRHGDRFADARRKVEAKLDALPAAMRVAVIATTRPRGTLESLDAARARLARIVPGEGSASLGPAIEAALELLEGHADGRLVIASDFDRRALEGLSSPPERLRQVAVTIVDVGADEVRDARVERVSVRPSPAVAGERLRVRARIGARGLAGPFEAELELDGKPVARKLAPVDGDVDFEVKAPRSGVLEGAVAIHAPGDRLDADDRAWFAAPVRRGLAVVLSGRDGTTAARSPQAGSIYPVAEALAALSEAWGLDVSVRVVGEDALGGELERTDAAILVAPALPPAAREAIEKARARGAGVAILLDETVPVAALAELRAHGAIPAAAIPAPAGAAAPPMGDEPELGPLLPALRAAGLAPQATLREVDGDARVLLVDAHGAPLWVARDRASVLAFAPSGRSSSLERHGALPLLVARVLRDAVGAEESTAGIIGHAVSLEKLARAAGVAEAALARASLEEPGAARRPLGAVREVVPPASGVTRILAPDGTPILAFASGPDPRETALERATDAARARLVTGAAAAASTSPDADQTGRATALAITLLLAASLLANRGLAAKAAAREPAQP